MAQELMLRGTHDPVKIRSPWAVALLPIVTFGIYGFIWWYRIHKELKAYGDARGYDLGQNPTNSLLAMFPGGMIIIPGLITLWRGTKRVQGAARIAGTEPVNGWMALSLYVVITPAMSAYLQASLNRTWRREAEPTGGWTAPPAVDRMPPRLPQTGI